MTPANDTPMHRELPLYGTEPAEPGLYLGLFHGRNDPTDQMIDWGFNGPLIGPLTFVHTTYTSTIKLDFVSDKDARRYFPNQGDHMLTVSEDMVLFDSKFYGDWTVFYVGDADCALPPDTFRQCPRPARSLAAHQQEVPNRNLRYCLEPATEISKCQTLARQALIGLVNNS
jgi:hypothetical protein